MKRRILVLAIVALLLLAAGCGSQSDSAGDKDGEDMAAQAGETGQPPIFPDRAPDMMGRVENIDGNKITLYKVMMEQGEGAAAPPEGREQPPAPPEERPEPPPGGGEQPPAPADGANGEERPRSREGLFETTDEKIELTISAETAIIQGGGFEENKDAAALDPGDIQIGDIFRIWLGDESPEGEQGVELMQLLPLRR